jgi:hypothetical protein
MSFELVWGGYYASHGADGYSAFRLLDLDPFVLHIQLLEGTFPEEPMLEQVKAAPLVAMHAPISPQQIIDERPKLLGSAPLQPEDLEGYKIYLEAMDASQEHIHQAVARIVENSQKPHPELVNVTARVDGGFDIVAAPAAQE